tara:strand:- start:509 stop:1345 length:837 start_codon:yes stop_codon:yes gene_type:complete
MSEVEGNNLIRDALIQGNPFSAGKLGAGECRALSNYLHHKIHGINPIQWPSYPHIELFHGAGVFPPSPETFTQFCGIFLESLKTLDIAGVWQNELEEFILQYASPQSSFCNARGLEPYYHEDPWTRYLEGKTLLVISPFIESISTQLPKITDVWRDKPLFPNVKVATLKIPFSAATTPSPFSSWEDGLLKLQDAVKTIDFDIAIVGAGAWSLPLISFCKSLGKSGVHLGGATQILFGIKGKRWDNHNVISGFYNGHWIRPLPQEIPPQAAIVEGGCYW